MPEYLYWLLKYSVQSLRSLGSGATLAEVSQAQLQTYRIPLAPIAEQIRIAEALRSCSDTINATRPAPSAQLDTARALSRAFVRSEIPDALPAGWRRVALEQVVIGKGQYGLSVAASGDTNGLPILRMGNIVSGRMAWDDLQYVRPDSVDVKPFLLDKGDILFNRTNSAELVGKTAVFDGFRGATFASYLIRFRVEPAVADPGYVAHYINSPRGREFIAQSMARAIGQANISASTVAKMPIAIPPVSVQTEIATRLDARLEGVRQLEALLISQTSELECLRRSLVSAAMTGRL